jgi:malate/lactate dehydrogenase
MEKTLKVVVTGAGGRIGSVLCFLLGTQQIFRPGFKVNLVMVELAQFRDRLVGLKMELEVSQSIAERLI